MFNPYFNPQGNVERINSQIKELENLRNQYQNMPNMQTQPITQNIINTGGSTIDFEAKYIKDNEDISNIPINRRTAFIDLNKGKLSIKEMDGNIKEYPIIFPKDEKDLKIEELEKNNALLSQKLNEMEMMINANTKPIEPTIEVERQTNNATKSSRSKSTV